MALASSNPPQAGRRTCDLHDLCPVADVDGLVGQGLEEWQHLEEVVDGVPAVNVGLPVPQRLGQLPALVLERQHLLPPLLNLLDHVRPEVVAIALDGAHNICVQPARIPEGWQGQHMREWWGASHLHADGANAAPWTAVSCRGAQQLTCRACRAW